MYSQRNLVSAARGMVSRKELNNKSLHYSIKNDKQLMKLARNTQLRLVKGGTLVASKMPYCTVAETRRDEKF